MFGQTQKSTAAPSENIIDEMMGLSPEDMRERVTSMTSGELAKTIKEMNDAKETPKVFQEQETQDAIALRMEELTATIEARQEELQRANSTDNDQNAEEKFVKEVKEKGGLRYHVSNAILTVLSWLGFKKAKALKESLSEKGFLRTAAESAIKYPIFAAFLARIGVTAGSEVKKYLTDNEEAITQKIAEDIQTSGKPAEEIVQSYADKMKNVVAQAADGGITVLATGLSYILGGTYNEETGVVEIPSILGVPMTIRPPVVMAWQAGARLRGGNAVTKAAYSTLLVQSKLKSFLKDSSGAEKRIDAAMSGKRALAQRALEIVAKNKGFAVIGKEGQELSDILTVMEKDVGFSAKDVMHTVGVNPAELDARRKEVLSHMDAVSKEEIKEFQETKNRVEKILADADKNLKTGNHPGSPDIYRQTAINDVNKLTAEFNTKVSSMKTGEAQKAAVLMNMLSVQGENHLNKAGTANVVNRGLEATARSVESFGFSMARSPAGFVVKGVAAMSFLPLITEGMASFRQGKEGEAARKAVTLDAAEAGLGFVPIVGNVMDFRAAFTGTDLNGRELDTWSRVTSAGFGTVGMAADILGFFTFGGTSVAYRAARGAFGAGKAILKTRSAVKVAGASEKVLKSMDTAADTMKSMENMYATTTRLSKTGSLLHKANNVARGAQHTMQLVTYGHLGVTLASGMSTVAENVGGALNKTGVFIEKGAAAVETGIDATTEAAGRAQDFIVDHLPFSPDSNGTN